MATSSTSKQTQLDFKQTRPRHEKNIKKEPVASNVESTSTIPQSYDEDSYKNEEILKQFDLNLSFGPCIGISRLERWERAQELGLNPPMTVYNLLTRHMNDRNYTQCLWKDEVGLVPPQSATTTGVN